VQLCWSLSWYVVVIYGIAFLGIKLGPQNAAYLFFFFFKMICVTSAILACELLAYILVGPLRLFLINLCGSLVEVLRRWYKQKFMCSSITQQL